MTTLCTGPASDEGIWTYIKIYIANFQRKTGGNFDASRQFALNPN